MMDLQHLNKFKKKSNTNEFELTITSNRVSSCVSVMKSVSGSCIKKEKSECFVLEQMASISFPNILMMRRRQEVLESKFKNRKKLNINKKQSGKISQLSQQIFVKFMPH